MRATLHLAWREWKGYFASWLAWVLLAGWSLLGGVAWSYALGQASDFPVASLFLNWLSLLLIAAPLLTMRSLAEERRDGTLDLLLCSPLDEWQIAGGKWLGACGFVVVLLLATLPFPYWLFEHGAIDAGPLRAGYLALILAGAGFCAWGVLCSSLSDSPVLAAIGGCGGLLLSWLLGFAPALLPTSPAAPVLAQASVWTHLEPLMRGLLDTHDLLFWASLCALCLFATTRALQSRHWR
jgi:ABC-2 type transport system permease protein